LIHQPLNKLLHWFSKYSWTACIIMAATTQANILNRPGYTQELVICPLKVGDMLRNPDPKHLWEIFHNPLHTLPVDEREIILSYTPCLLFSACVTCSPHRSVIAFLGDPVIRSPDIATNAFHCWYHDLLLHQDQMNIMMRFDNVILITLWHVPLLGINFPLGLCKLPCTSYKVHLKKFEDLHMCVTITVNFHTSCWDISGCIKKRSLNFSTSKQWKQTDRHRQCISHWDVRILNWYSSDSFWVSWIPNYDRVTH
jgi:hypothetical protein